MTPEAHILCPYCYPVDPEKGDEVVYWCGTKSQIKMGNATAHLPRCFTCQTSRNCATCGAFLSPFGTIVFPSDSEEAKKK